MGFVFLSSDELYVPVHFINRKITTILEPNYQILLEIYVGDKKEIQLRDHLGSNEFPFQAMLWKILGRILLECI